MAESQSIRFGILCCADIARKNSRAIILSPNSTLHAIADRSLDIAREFAKSNNFPPSTKIYGSFDELLNDADVDAVYIPLPTSFHLQWAVIAANKKKHLLLEKPAALNVAELDAILDACEKNGVQFMDGTMWMHHPRTPKMAEFLADPLKFGQLKSIHTIFSFEADENFLENNIRVKPDLDALGALGDIGWYCIRATLWAADYQLPKFVTALRNPVKNKAGVVLSCGASFHWEDGKIATFYCSFFGNLTMDMTAIGTKGTLHVNDFVISCKGNGASYSTLSEGGFTDMYMEWNKEASKHSVDPGFPQEVHMVKEFTSLVDGIKHHGCAPDKKWPDITRKTQVLVDAVLASIDKGFEPVEVLF